MTYRIEHSGTNEKFLVWEENAPTVKEITEAAAKEFPETPIEKLLIEPIGVDTVIMMTAD